jgi:hypothetical protein
MEIEVVWDTWTQRRQCTRKMETVMCVINVHLLLLDWLTVWDNVWNLRFLHPCFWRWKSSGRWCSAIRGVVADVQRQCNPSECREPHIKSHSTTSKMTWIFMIILLCKKKILALEYLYTKPMFYAHFILYFHCNTPLHLYHFLIYTLSFPV